MNCVWCERPIRPHGALKARSLENVNPDSPKGAPRTMVGIVHEKCLAVFRALMWEALRPQ